MEGTTKGTVQLPVHHWLQEEGHLPLIFPNQSYSRNGSKLNRTKKNNKLCFKLNTVTLKTNELVWYDEELVCV